MNSNTDNDTTPSFYLHLHVVISFHLSISVFFLLHFMKTNSYVSFFFFSFLKKKKKGPFGTRNSNSAYVIAFTENLMKQCLTKILKTVFEFCLFNFVMYSLNPDFEFESLIRRRF